jgi:hypothetical protein
VDHAHGGERAKTGADARPADADVLGELALGRQPITRSQLAAFDLSADVVYHLFGRCPFVPPIVAIVVHHHCRLPSLPRSPRSSR